MHIDTQSHPTVFLVRTGVHDHVCMERSRDLGLTMNLAYAVELIQVLLQALVLGRSLVGDWTFEFR